MTGLQPVVSLRADPYGQGYGVIMRAEPSVTFDHGIFVAQRHGGVSRYFVELARHLGRSGVAVAVDSPIYVTDGLRSLVDDGVVVRGRHVPVFPGVTRLGETLAGFPRRLRSDVLHETWYGKSPTRRKQGLLAVTLHDMISELFPESVKGAGFQSQRKREAVARADVIFCVSETTRRDAMGLLGLPGERFVVTPLASSLPVLPRAETGKPFILYVGKRGGYKNFPLLLEAFSVDPTLRGALTIVCFGGGGFSEDERRLISQAGEVIHVDGDDLALARWYAGARAFVSTSHYEGFGIPLVEAMSAGCPVIAVGGGSVPEVGGDAIVSIGDSPDELAAHLRRLFDDEWRTVVAEAGRVRSRRYSWQRTAALTLDAYRESRIS